MDLPDPGTELGSPALQVDSLPTELSGKSMLSPHHEPITILISFTCVYLSSFIPVSQ